MWTRNLSQYNRTNLFLWLALSIQGGMINAGGFLACRRFVTHTTGFATQFGVEFGLGRWMEAAGALMVPMFFLSGAMLSAYFTDRRLSRGQEPRYSLLIGLVAALMFLVSALGSFGQFGVFGEPFQIQTGFLLVALLCLASGIQNGAVTWASGAVIRTTHLTGLTTDLGIGLVRLMSHPQPEAREQEFQSSRVRACLIFGFIMGSTIGAFAFLRLGYAGFLVPGLLSTVLFFMGLRLTNQRKRQQATRISA